MPAARNLCCAARMEGLPRALCESARVLRVAREGAATSVVAQMLRSNAVLNCTVRTNALKREQINSLEAGQTVLLLCRHWKYALEPCTMVFHHRRLASVFWCPQAICVLASAASTAARAQRKAFRIIRENKAKRWLNAVSVILPCAFNHQKGCADVTRIIVNLLEAWEKQQPRDRTYASYILDEAVEDALLGASVRYAPRHAPRHAPSKRPKLC